MRRTVGSKSTAILGGTLLVAPNFWLPSPALPHGARIAFEDRTVDDLAVMSSTNPPRSLKCSSCSYMLPLDHSGPCPRCGDPRKTHDIYIEAKLDFKGSVQWQHVREYYEKHPVALAVVILLSIGSSFLGLITGWIGVAAGLLIGVITFFIGPRAVTKVREIRSGS